ncbi:DUF805 domain-containing protein [Caulobacter rhizosphaerae]|jgi:uncharacterized membrane protein YhaH (DUF805 family)|uniref:Uncharacterized membrane protein YhaH (DUF805 family) n=1 Tax=Caulobacter rhizosphaerae TaxID=2010972 RepID=A0ABU1MT77_9CAUL|nr:DUF805 domain-containing protein [Caulobacter rhizosphaerae]MDR6529390.1 uncharacterized membrane protein YhaH (DUF805 family) [Caulobacter rhizosphaerae]GGL23068.1 membrane protein [Caulobacter rhizosphaerae]
MMFEALRKYAEFEGRARRSEYWLFTLFQVLVTFGLFLALVMVAAATGGGDGQLNVAASIFLALLGLFCLAMLIPSLAVSIRRLHDSDKSGWWLLLSFVPFGSFVVFIFTLLDGTPGENRYGPDPKGRPGYGHPTVVHNHYYPPAGGPPSDPAQA